MADPLSIAAGVVGILTAAAQISSLLTTFTASAKDAPRQAQVIITEVNDTSEILSRLQAFLSGKEASGKSRASLLKADQVVTIVSGCVLTFSELEKVLDSLKMENMDVLDRFKWARKRRVIAGLIHRLQNHKASLSLIFNVLNGETIAEAKSSVDQLLTLVETCYREMSSRVHALEAREMQCIDMDLRLCEDNVASIVTATRANSNPNQTMTGPGLSTSDFTQDLQRSWVYKRNDAFRESLYSTSTRSVYNTRWSVLSGLSMADQSDVSVLNLPIVEEEVFNPHRSTQTWSNECSEQKGPSRPSTRFSRRDDEDQVLWTCKRCHDTTEDEGIRIDDDHWHVQCFYCSVCEGQLQDDDPVTIVNCDSLICDSCNPCCNVCRQTVENMVFLSAEEAFCPECFRCRFCNEKIAGQMCARPSDGLSCMDCHTSLLLRSIEHQYHLGKPPTPTKTRFPSEALSTTQNRPLVYTIDEASLSTSFASRKSTITNRAASADVAKLFPLAAKIRVKEGGYF